MTLRTDRSAGHRDLSAGFVSTLGLAAMIVLAYAIWHTSRSGYLYGIIPEVTLPSILVSGWTIQQHGLVIFRGDAPLPMNPQYFSMLGLSLLLFFVVGPVLLIVFVRRRLLKQSPPLPDIISVAGLVIGLAWMVGSSGVLFSYQDSKAHLIQNNYRIHWMADRVVDHLNEIRMEAAVFAALPRSREGGGGSLRRYELPARLRSPRMADFELEHVGEDIRVRATILPGAWETWGGSIDGVPANASVTATITSDGKTEGWKWEGLR